ncbi:MAG: Smr/MutS family protein [Acidobacteria bacterium]|nr:Smr/MutS family protein [Acidobacteriota bacterium]
MAARFTVGGAVQTSFGKGIVREVRNNGRLLVDVRGRALVVKESEISLLDAGSQSRFRDRTVNSRRAPSQAQPDAGADESAGAREVDLHGLIVEAALARAEQALNEALLTDVAELRLIHGRSGGRIRAALHRLLREIPSVRGFQLDPRNEGVTIVRL